MNKKDIITLVILAILTISTAVFSNTETIKYVVAIILVLSAIKFFLVAFQFMELKKAHGLWKGLVIGFVSFFVLIISLFLH